MSRNLKNKADSKRQRRMPMKNEIRKRRQMMKTRKHDTRWMVSVALMSAIVIVLANTPLGMIHLPIVKATTVHIPVIIGAILLGPSAGAILGFVFGVCSLISNTMAPT